MVQIATDAARELQDRRSALATAILPGSGTSGTPEPAATYVGSTVSLLVNRAEAGYHTIVAVVYAAAVFGAEANGIDLTQGCKQDHQCDTLAPDSWFCYLVNQTWT